MEVPVIRIGNSKGIRLSKELLKRYNISDTIEVILEHGHIVLKPVHSPRKGWDEAFAQMAERGEDAPLIPDVLTDEDFEKWE